jgi:hypothetical protein
MKEWLIPLLIAGIAPLFGFLGIAWKLSGKIGSSDASKLWDEATTMRKEYKESLQECEAKVKQLRDELRELRAAS